jgi:lysophospholipase L1-like esterase
MRKSLLLATAALATSACVAKAVVSAPIETKIPPAYEPSVPTQVQQLATATPRPTEAPQPPMPTEKSDLKFVLVGDSITRGHSLYGAPLQKYLADDIPDKKVELEIEGYPCQRIDGKPLQFCGGVFNIPAPLDAIEKDILPEKPDYALLWFGMNVRDEKDARKQIDSYREIAGKMTEAGIRPVILTPISDCRDPVHNKVLSALAEDEKKLAAEEGYQLIDTRTQLDGSAASCAKDYSDKIHPNRAGHDKLGRYIADELAEGR